MVKGRSRAAGGEEEGPKKPEQELSGVVREKDGARVAGLGLGAGESMEMAKTLFKFGFVLDSFRAKVVCSQSLETVMNQGGVGNGVGVSDGGSTGEVKGSGKG